MTFNRARKSGGLRPSLGDAGAITLERTRPSDLLRGDRGGVFRGVRARDARARMLAGARLSDSRIVYTWRPKGAQAIPLSMSYSRGSVAQVQTKQTATSNLVYQEVPDNLVRLKGLRLVNHADGVDYGFGALGYQWTDVGTDELKIAGGGYFWEVSSTNQMNTVNPTSGLWAKIGTTATGGTTGSHGLAEYTLDAGTSTGTHYIAHNLSTGVSGARWVRAKQGTGRYLGLKLGASSTSDFLVADLQTGAITQVGGGLTSSFIIDDEDGWYIVGGVQPNPEGNFRIGFSDSATPGTNEPSFTGSNETIFISHIQAEPNNFPTSPIVTAGSVLSRSADSLTGANWLSSSPYSVYVDKTAPNLITAESQTFQFGSGASNSLSYDNSGNITLSIDDNLQLDPSGGVSALERDKFFLRYAENDSALAVSGKATVTDASVSLNSNARGNLLVGVGGPSSVIHEIEIYHTAEENSFLEARVGN